MATLREDRSSDDEHRSAAHAMARLLLRGDAGSASRDVKISGVWQRCDGADRSCRPTLARVLLIGVASSVVLLGCGSTEPDANPSGTQAPPERTTATTALQFSAPLVGGGQFDGASVVGTPVAFWFWAPT
jgi:hypothetical protein